ncbi:hypothetical protein PHYPSEUDO_013316 [Phytophthora pseudosyringae]|uniref:Uncharacterized protein n=1 Tax=Phytophthora pseudosyringae TaxID=221518 RepID=A0A8T1V816_9STRA|nr:hypothetical protein PHYPSEUDO_013316 [Phytophthora pseudosyringae]
MPSLLTLLLFCDFLERRLHTSNLVLLRRMLRDFFAGNERTLRDFVRLGASVVTIAPMERAHQRHRQEAARLLEQQAQLPEDSKQQAQLCVFRYLSARVATKNILWLRDMYHEFCSGRDTLVREFVRRGNEVVSVIPVDIQALQAAALQSTELASDEGDASGSDEDDDNEIASLAELATVGSMPPTQNELRACIMEVLDRIEQQEPWKQVFDSDSLPLPFKRRKLTAALATFWAEHGRAVWERRFWGPLVKLLDQRRRHLARKSRQYKARGAFKMVTTLVYEEHGANFFVQMDQRTRLHKGWWYSEPVQDLVSIAQHQSLAACLHYMESQALERFPTVPGRDTSEGKPSTCKSKSMWSTASAMAPILREICAIKDANTCATNKKKK